MATYEERRADRQDRLDSRRESLESAATARYQTARAAVEHIPFGQPILVGHHSEGKHRAAIAKQDRNMRAACELFKAAEQIPTAPTTAILATDADALDVLAAKIAKAEAAQQRMKDINAACRKKDAARLAELGCDPANVAQWLDPSTSKWDRGIPAYALSNNNANIARMKERLAHLEKTKAAEPKEEERDGVRIEEDPEAVRLRLHFDGKPDPTTIADLKSSGFRWAPSEQAWQRQLSNAARHCAKYVLDRRAERASKEA